MLLKDKAGFDSVNHEFQSPVLSILYSVRNLSSEASVTVMSSPKPANQFKTLVKAVNGVGSVFRSLTDHCFLCLHVP